MGAIVPAILPKSRLDLEEKIARLSDIEGVDSVQIDIVDGKYAAPPCWPYTEKVEDLAKTLSAGGQLPHFGNISFEVDLMVTNPEEVIGSWITLGASRVTVHAGSTNFLSQLFDDMHKKFGHDKEFAPNLLSLGLAIGISADLRVIEPFLPHTDYVQFMGIRSIGKQGEPFDREVLQKIAAFRKKYPDMPIQVDGGVTMASAPDLLRAGVDRLVIGSALFTAPDLKKQFAAFSALTEEYGIYE